MNTPPPRDHKATADDYASDAMQYLVSGVTDASNNPNAEIRTGIGYALLALDSRLRELLILLDERL